MAHHEYNSNTTRGGDSESKRDSENANDPILVDAPTTGAVGHLPVLEPGDVFSYMSGCQLQTREGEMEGCFHLAKVPAGTRSARVGDTVEALASLTVEKLKLEVNGFPLRVPTD
eukprot:CAMPEP_0202476074 /NCGR_PEP_ID=MMETSP1360-20130828/93232_1 /ASSEMBLY_ACC=CAM_ASM_000848 /TAXON_ID=515479 /ORGANISM="Licmophora paradoxa, Strain CCMP2313" /LENGTH=113 /DNA_ID=CAMNT_0049103263 /DNA_START=881 /DNA_END=1223 /DNA_ORIENTATION=+